MKGGAMKPLSAVLIFKIVVTALFWSIPLLILPTNCLRRLGFPQITPPIFLRLLGMSYAALLVAYSFGLRDSLQNIYPSRIVWIGIASNGGAFIVLFLGALSKTWSSWGICAQIFMWGSLIATALITVGLIRFGIMRIS